jgi:hypothetical protein
LEKDACLVYDFIIKHFCFIIDQKMNHRLNFPAKTVPIERQAKLKCFVEEVLANSYSFQVGKVLPAIPILRGVDQGLSAFWTIRLSVFASTDVYFVFLSTTYFHTEQEAIFAYNHLMPKVRELGNPASSFNRNFCDYQPFVGFEAQLDIYFEAHLRLHPVLLSMAAVSIPDVPSSNDPIPLKRLRGVLQQGSGFIVRISVPNSANQAIIHHLPQVYSTRMDAALAYDCITRLLLPYRARPSPLNFTTSFATPECSASMNTYFEGHLLPLLPDLKDDSDFVAVLTKKDKMTLVQARSYFVAQRRDGPVHPCCCCRRTWFKRCVRALTDKFLEKILDKIKYALTNLSGPDEVRRLCNTCYSSFQRWKAPKMCETNMPDLPVIPNELQDMTDMENHLVSPRIPFMKVYALPRGGQRGVHGGMVNVPTNLTKIQQLLPRQLHFRESITINLSRRVCFKGTFKTSGCRPARVVQQLQYLCSTELYKSLEVTLDKSWLPLADTQLSEELLQAALATEAASLEGGGSALGEQLDVATVGELVEKKVCSADEEDALRRNWDEVGEYSTEGASEQRNVSPTMLDQLNSAGFLNQTLIVAPGEGMTPITLFMDKHCEEASFPNIYCGTLHEFGKGILFCDRARWELTNIDRRVAHCIETSFLK